MLIEWIFIGNTNIPSNYPANNGNEHPNQIEPGGRTVSPKASPTESDNQNQPTVNADRFDKQFKQSEPDNSQAIQDTTHNLDDIDKHDSTNEGKEYNEEQTVDYNPEYSNPDYVDPNQQYADPDQYANPEQYQEQYNPDQPQYDPNQEYAEGYAADQQYTADPNQQYAEDQQYTAEYDPNQQYAQ